MSRIRQEIRAQSVDFGQFIDLRLRVSDGQYSHQEAKPIQLAPLQDGKEIGPFIQLRMEEAQILFDELWECGIRPEKAEKKARGRDEDNASMRAHLEDMRKIAFSLIGLNAGEVS